MIIESNLLNNPIDDGGNKGKINLNSGLLSQHEAGKKTHKDN